MKSSIARTANATRSYVPCVALRCVAWLVIAATQRNAQQRSTSNATQRAAQRMWTRPLALCDHGVQVWAVEDHSSGEMTKVGVLITTTDAELYTPVHFTVSKNFHR